jgi:ATP-binding cassette subfamily F protein 3
METSIRNVIPDIDPVLSQYASGYLQHAVGRAAATQLDDDPLTDAGSRVTSLLISAAGNPSKKQEDSIRELVAKFVKQLAEQNGHNGTSQRGPLAIRRLDQAINVATQKDMSAAVGLAGLAAGSTDLDAVGSRKVESKVDRKKLEKAERKIRAKQDRKEMKLVEYEASKLIYTEENQEAYEDFFMAVNPLDLNDGSGTKSKDIKVEGIDLAIGALRILTDTTLTLAYGRRYGLVGQNGIGKSTLLRALSRRELAIPTHITILHVEQEVSQLIK